MVVKTEDWRLKSEERRKSGGEMVLRKDNSLQKQNSEWWHCLYVACSVALLRLRIGQNCLIKEARGVVWCGLGVQRVCDCQFWVEPGEFQGGYDFQFFSSFFFPLHPPRFMVGFISDLLFLRYLLKITNMATSDLNADSDAVPEFPSPFTSWDSAFDPYRFSDSRG